MCLGIPGKIISVYEKDGIAMGKIDLNGVTREVCLVYTPEAHDGDYALIHVGFALNLLSEQEAFETLELLRQMAAAGEEEMLETNLPPQGVE